LRAKAKVLPSLPTPAPENVTEGTLFDELIAQYATLTARSEDLIVKHVVSEVESLLRQHLARCVFFLLERRLLRSDSPWSTGSEMQFSLPATLLAPITSFQQQLAFIASVLPTSSVTILYRQIASSISSHLVDRMVFQHSRGKIDPSDATALATEYRLWIECSKQAVGKIVRKIDVPWERLRDAASLLGLTTEDFASLLQVTRDGKPDMFQGSMEQLGVASYSPADVKQVLRLRTDFVN